MQLHNLFCRPVSAEGATALGPQRQIGGKPINKFIKSRNDYVNIDAVAFIDMREVDATRRAYRLYSDDRRLIDRASPDEVLRVVANES